MYNRVSFVSILLFQIAFDKQISTKLTTAQRDMVRMRIRNTFVCIVCAVIVRSTFHVHPGEIRVISSSVISYGSCTCNYYNYFHFSFLPHSRCYITCIICAAFSHRESNKRRRSRRRKHPSTDVCVSNYICLSFIRRTHTLVICTQYFIIGRTFILVVRRIQSQSSQKNA